MWTGLFERGGCLPDDIIALQDPSEGGEFLLQRWYSGDREAIDARIALRREGEETARKLREVADRYAVHSPGGIYCSINVITYHCDSVLCYT